MFKNVQRSVRLYMSYTDLVTSEHLKMCLSENNTYPEDVHSTISSSTQTAVFKAVLRFTFLTVLLHH